jgi:hypothetical protein
MARGFGWKQGNKITPALSPAQGNQRFGWRGNKTFPVAHYAGGGVVPALDPTAVGQGEQGKYDPSSVMPWKNPQGASNPGPGAIPGTRTPIDPTFTNPATLPTDSGRGNPAIDPSSKPPGGPIYLGPPIQAPPSQVNPSGYPGVMPPPPIQGVSDLPPSGGGGLPTDSGGGNPTPVPPYGFPPTLIDQGGISATPWGLPWPPQPQAGQQQPKSPWGWALPGQRRQRP